MRRSPFAKARQAKQQHARDDVGGEGHIEPTPERQARGKIVRISPRTPILDSRDALSRPYRALDILQRLEARGVITPEMAKAGARFHRIFRKAQLDYLHAPDLSRIPMRGKRREEESDSVDKCRELISKRIFLLGGFAEIGGSCAWHVLGCEMSLREWAATRVWNGPRIDLHEARGALRVTLSILRAADSAEFKRSRGALLPVADDMQSRKLPSFYDTSDISQDDSLLTI